MPIVSITSINSYGADILQTKKLADKVYSAPLKLLRGLEIDLPRIFSDTTKVSESTINQPNKEDTRDYIIKFDCGYEYILSFLPNTYDMFSEQVRFNGDVEFYQDIISEEPAIGKKFMSKKDTILDYRKAYPKTTCCALCLWTDEFNLYKERNSTYIIDLSDGGWERFDFSPTDLEFIIPIMKALFCDENIKTILSSGVCIKEICGNEFAFDLGSQGSGYRKVLSILKSILCLRGGNTKMTLMLIGWDISLHPILRNALLEIIKKADINGTVFLEE